MGPTPSLDRRTRRRRDVGPVALDHLVDDLVRTTFGLAPLPGDEDWPELDGAMPDPVGVEAAHR